jgi:hypothetical protein
MALARQKVAVAAKEVLQINDVQIISARVKKDMLWVGVSVAVALGIGLAVGSLIKF